jgi:hypothetical protein
MQFFLVAEACGRDAGSFEDESYATPAGSARMYEVDTTGLAVVEFEGACE